MAAEDFNKTYCNRKVGVFMKIYIAAPLFNQMELERNERIDKRLQELGYTTYLPQRDGGRFAELIHAGMDPIKAGEEIYRKDIEAVTNCDIVLFLFDGRVPDEGACFELGVAVALNKKCYGLCTDVRSFIEGNQNLMLKHSIKKMLYSELELYKFMKRT